MPQFKDIVVRGHRQHTQRVRSGEKLRFLVHEGASLEYFLPVLDGKNSKTELRVELQGTEARAEGRVLFFGDQKQEQQLRVEHVHFGRNTSSRIDAKGAVKDAAKSVFWGSIRMVAGSDGAEGVLNEHSLLLSPNAKLEAVPALEIEHDNVQARHAATLEKIDEEKLFYLLSRGLSEHEAMELLVEGFFRDALEFLPIEEREELYSAILKKL